MPGLLALIGGGEWTAGCEPIDRAILAAAAAVTDSEAPVNEVLVLTTAAAYHQPHKALAVARSYFQELGATVTTTPLLTRTDASNPSVLEDLRRARCIYLCGGSPFHLKSVLQGTPAWTTIVSTWWAGTALAGSSAGAMVLGDPMVDPRGGAFTIGLGLIAGFAILPHADTWSPAKVQRTRKMVNAAVTIAEVAERAALVWQEADGWTAIGAGPGHGVEVRTGAQLAKLANVPVPAIPLVR